MGFIDSYKHLEKLCGEILNDNRRISAYIDEMLSTPIGSYYVRTWDEDLKNLKHYRRVRNQISHELGCTEENMCDSEDTLCLDKFYSRIINQTDPLSLYYQATHPCSAAKPISRSTKTTPTYNHPSNFRKHTRNIGCATLMIVSLIVIVEIVLFTQLYEYILLEGFAFKEFLFFHSNYHQVCSICRCCYKCWRLSQSRYIK